MTYLSDEHKDAKIVDAVAEMVIIAKDTFNLNKDDISYLINKLYEALIEIGRRKESRNRI